MPSPGSGFDADQSSVFKSILIQTNRRCTRGCQHCFYGQHDYSSDDVLEFPVVIQILDELAAIDYRGRLSFYGNNEPLTDPRIYDFMAEGRRKVPGAFHFLQTNGDLLNDELIERLLCVVDALQVNAYDSSALRYRHNGLRVVDKRAVDPSAWSSKAGALQGIGGSPQAGCCANPFQQIYIAPPGVVPVCTADAFLCNPLGDVRTEGLLNIWNNDGFRRIRRELSAGTRRHLPMCAKCDSPGAMLMEVASEA